MVPVSKRWGLPPGDPGVIWKFSTGNQMPGTVSALPHLPPQTCRWPLHPAAHPWPNPTSPSLHTPGAALMCERRLLFAEEPWSLKFCKRNLNLHPLEDPGPTFSLWQTGSWSVHPLGLRTHLLTVVIHPLGAAGKQWNLLLRELRDYFASTRKACFHSRLEEKNFAKTPDNSLIRQEDRKGWNEDFKV